MEENYENENDQSQKLHMISFTTNEKSHSPNEIISKYYLNKIKYIIIKKSKEILAFSTFFKVKERPYKVMICTLTDLSMEYEGIDNVNCYLIIVDLQNSNSKEKFVEILSYFDAYCDLSKKIYILGVKNNEEENGIKISEDEIAERITNFEYEYFELNLDNENDVTDKIKEIFNYCYEHPDKETNSKDDNNANSCSIY